MKYDAFLCQGLETITKNTITNSAWVQASLPMFLGGVKQAVTTILHLFVIHDPDIAEVHTLTTIISCDPSSQKAWHTVSS